MRSDAEREEIMQQIRISIISMILLAVFYYCIRFPLFALHGMKDWPKLLGICGACVILADAVFSGGTILSLSAAFGYPAGFLAGMLLGRSYGTGRSSMWIVWAAVYLAVIIIGAVCRKKKRS